MRKHFKSRFPAFNIPRHSEEVATDTIFSDTPAIDSGVTMALIFVGKRTLVTDVYPLKSQKQFFNTLEDNIRFRGAMTKLISDYAKVEISNKVKDILRMYHSSSWNSEPYHQNQNPPEGRYCTLKSWTNTIMNRSGAPADCWLLCMIHASYILNHLSCEALAGNVPLGINGYQKIRVHLIFAVKHDGRHKARLVAGGHLTPDLIESIYSGIVSIRSLRLVIFLAKLNNLEVWGADIGNAYLEAKTKESYTLLQAQSLRNLKDMYWLYTKHYMD